MITGLFISIGGMLGAVTRFFISKKVKEITGSDFPVGTLTVNMLGSFLLGILFGIHVQGDLFALLGIGFMGAFTTFSTLKLELMQMAMERKKRAFLSYLVVTYAGGLALAFAGVLIGRMF